MVGVEPIIKDFERIKQKEVARILEVSVKSIQNYQAQGMINTGRKSGRSVYYFGKDVKRCWRKFFNQPL